MLSNSQLKELGVPAWHYETARAYENLFRSYGWNDKQISEATKFGANFKGSEDELVAAFKFRAAYLDAPELDQAVDAGLGLRNMIAEHGIEAFPAVANDRAERQDAAERQPDAKSAQSRLEEIRAISRDDPRAYENNKALQAEELVLIEASLAAKSKEKGVSDKPEPTPWRGPAKYPQLEQIRELRRNDPDAWEADKALQARELSLIEASFPPVPATSCSGDTSSSSSQGTSEGNASVGT